MSKKRKRMKEIQLGLVYALHLSVDLTRRREEEEEERRGEERL